MYAAETVYLVVVRYGDGDTFGHTYGNWTVFAATASEEEALKIGESIEDGSLVKKKPGYYRWTAYFNSLESVEIHAFRVRDAAPTSTTPSRISIRRH